MTLFELNSLVRDVLENELSDAFWVTAELSEAREVRGHCYMELVQKDPFQSVPVARASAKCWKNKWQTLGARFVQVTGQSLCPGMQVLLLVTPSFHEAFGFSWIVQDMDPTFTLGDMAQKRQNIIRQLKEEGVFDLQKQLELPLFPQHIAVISSENAAGYGDFCNQLADNAYGFSFSTKLFPAIMQGEKVEESVVVALDAINQEIDSFDAVVIIRGGGATADMSGFDALVLAENVANFPLPIITGIGHERDESILDMISHTRVKTPTAAAAFLIDRLLQVAMRIERAEEVIGRCVVNKIEREQQCISNLAQRIPVLCRNVLLQKGYALDVVKGNIRIGVERALQREKHRLVMLEQKVKLLDPKLQLQRGYSITTHNGHCVLDYSKLKPGDELVTVLNNGTIKSKVI